MYQMRLECSLLRVPVCPWKLNSMIKKLKCFHTQPQNTNKVNEDMQNMQKTPKINKWHIVVGHLIHNKFYV